MIYENILAGSRQEWCFYCCPYRDCLNIPQQILQVLLTKFYSNVDPVLHRAVDHIPIMGWLAKCITCPNKLLDIFCQYG
jgi:hypothetical protein